MKKDSWNSCMYRHDKMNNDKIRSLREKKNVHFWINMKKKFSKEQKNVCVLKTGQNKIKRENKKG